MGSRPIRVVLAWRSAVEPDGNFPWSNTVSQLEAKGRIMTRAVSFLCLAAITVSGCDTADIMEPLSRRINTPQFSSSTMQIYVPPTNENGGSVAQQAIGQLQPGKWAIVKVAGKVTLSKN